MIAVPLQQTQALSKTSVGIFLVGARASPQSYPAMACPNHASPFGPSFPPPKFPKAHRAMLMEEAALM